MSAYKRKLKNYLLNPTIQIRYMYYLLAILAMPMSLFLAYVFLEFQKVKVHLIAGGQATDQFMLMIDRLNVNIVTATAIVFIFLSFIMVFGFILISHRFVGPQYVINNYLKALINGEKPFNRDLRKDDEFKDTFDLLKELATKLQGGNKN